MKKYQRYIVQRNSADHTGWRPLRSFYLRVEQRDGEWVAASKATEIRAGHADAQHYCGLIIDSVMIEDAPREENLVYVMPPHGYEVIAQHWLPDNYVPPSDDVMEETERRIKEDLIRRGFGHG